MTLALAPDLIILAGTLEDRAARVAALADTLSARSATTPWQGAAADRFRIAVGERCAHLRHGAEGLRSAAHQARILAAAVLP